MLGYSSWHGTPIPIPAFPLKGKECLIRVHPLLLRIYSLPSKLAAALVLLPFKGRTEVGMGSMAHDTRTGRGRGWAQCT